MPNKIAMTEPAPHKTRPGRNRNPPGGAKLAPKTRCFSSLTDEERLRICEMYSNERRKKNEISELFGVHKSTITRIVARFIETDSHKSMPKGGRVSHKKLQESQFEAVKEFYRSSKEPPTMKDIQSFCQDQFNVRLSIGTAFNVVKRIKSRIRAEADGPPPDPGDLIEQGETEEDFITVYLSE